MKRIVTVQDISCVGRCSLTAALPVISALGVECAVLPTAVLSNHTAFDGFTFHDLTAELSPIIKEWQRQGMHFDALYSGYLGSTAQIAIVSALIDRVRADNPHAFVVVDPAMADFGRLYTGFDKAFVSAMTELCKKADYILPNLTEASYILDIPYDETAAVSEPETILRALSDLGCPCPILTGVSGAPHTLGAMGYDRRRDVCFSYENTRLDQHFHGTGDIFASVVTGALVRGASVEDAMALAVDFVHASICATAADPEARWYGVSFEGELSMLCNAFVNKS